MSVIGDEDPPLAADQTLEYPAGYRVGGKVDVVDIELLALRQIVEVGRREKMHLSSADLVVLAVEAALRLSAGYYIKLVEIVTVQSGARLCRLHTDLDIDAIFSREI
jgi:hypothetical protein